MSTKRSAPKDVEQTEAKRQKKNKTKVNQDMATYDSTRVGQDLVFAKDKLKHVSFAPESKLQDVSDEDQARRPLMKTRTTRQNFLDFVSGIPPDRSAAKSRARRAATPAPLPSSGPSSRATIPRSVPPTTAGIANTLSLAATGISVIDFAYARRDTAPAEGLHPAIGDKPAFKGTEEPSAPPRIVTLMNNLEGIQMGTSNPVSLTNFLANGLKSGPVVDSASGCCDSAPLEELTKPAHDKPPNEETKMLPAPSERVAPRRKAAKSTSVRTEAKAKAKDLPVTTSRDRYGLRSRRKNVGYGSEAELRVESEQ